MKILVITFLLLAPICSFSQEEEVFDFNDEFWMIDAVRLSHENDTFQMFLDCEYLTSVSKSWTKMAADLCTYSLQQIGRLPFSSSEPIVTKLITSVSAWHDEDIYVQPRIRQLAFALLPLYRELCRYSINHFRPDQIATFEKTVRWEVPSNKDFYLQDLLLRIARTNPRNPDPNTKTLISKISEYYKDYPYSDTQIFDFVKERYEEQLNLVDEPVLIEH